MLNKIFKRVREKEILKAGDKVVVGFSSGPDSVFLLELLIFLKKELELEIILVHINHMLRGEDSEKDQEFAKEKAKDLGLEIYVKKVDIIEYAKDKGIGLEEAGREIRYSYFNEILEEKKANKIAIAHNLDDQIENFLFRMIRGSSLEGLEGIPSKDKIIRPINKIYKSDILHYLDSNNIKYRIDKTNFENEFTRNSIRLDLIPFIEKRYNKNFKEKIYNLIKEIQEVNSILKIDLLKYKEEIEDKTVLNIDKIQKENEYFQRKIINDYLKEFAIETSREKIVNIQNVLNVGGSKNISLNKRYILKKQYNYIWIEELKNKVKKEDKLIRIKIPFKIKVGNFIIEALESNQSFGKNEFLTNLKAGDELKIRYKKEGDKIQPLGMNSYKKIKDIFINEKIPKEVRDTIPLILRNDEVVWIAGIKKSEKFKSRKQESGIKLIIRREDAGKTRD